MRKQVVKGLSQQHKGKKINKKDEKMSNTDENVSIMDENLSKEFGSFKKYRNVGMKNSESNIYTGKSNTSRFKQSQIKNVR